MILHVLGSCSGTEPYPARHHTSVTLETEGSLYFFDAGENCCYTSYTMGLDQLSTQGIFISHTHMDHTGGLPHLLWNLRKLCLIDPANKARMQGRKISVYIPDLSVFEGIYQMLLGSEGHYETVFELEPHLIADGPLCEKGLKVEAFHNLHLGQPSAGEPWKSFSFTAQAEGKKILYSGDFGQLPELLPHAHQADLLFLETGHHRACDLCRELLESRVDFGKVVFYHHGVEILQDFEGELALAKQVLGDRVLFTNDGSRIEV